MRLIVWLLGVCVLGISSVASAQDVPERVGFQMALRTGYALPMGDVAEDGEMSDFVSGQVPLFVEIGGKLSPHLFLGGYLGLGFGGVDGTMEDECDAADATCVGVGVRAGIELQYHFLPRGSVNPWLGYGIGLESLAVGYEVDGEDGSTSYDGFEYARLSGGLDFRLSRAFGIGPFVDFSVGEYTSFNAEFANVEADGDIENGAAHQWLTLGVRAVFFP